MVGDAVGALVRGGDGHREGLPLHSGEGGRGEHQGEVEVQVVLQARRVQAVDRVDVGHRPPLLQDLRVEVLQRSLRGLGEDLLYPGHGAPTPRWAFKGAGCTRTVAPKVGIDAISVAGMRELDRVAIEDFHLPLEMMMENAGRALALFASKEAGAKRVLVVAGAGANGGGGLAAARHLHNWEVAANVLLLKPPEAYGGVSPPSNSGSSRTREWTLPWPQRAASCPPRTSSWTPWWATG